VPHRLARLELERLRQVAHREAGRREGDAAAVGRDLAGDDSQQRGLAAAVGPDQACALAVVEGEGDALEEKLSAERLRDAAKLKHIR